jgi:putative flippase GtrA
MNLLIRQAAKFVLVGILNTGIDFGVSNILMKVFNIYSGLGFSLFKGVGFAAAVINSYFLNKFWTFKSKSADRSGKQFVQFFVVSLIGFGVNVGVASLVVDMIGPQFNIGEKLWANFGILCATFASMVWNFVGYKFIVFKDAK